MQSWAATSWRISIPGRSGRSLPCPIRPCSAATAGMRSIKLSNVSGVKLYVAGSTHIDFPAAFLGVIDRGAAVDVMARDSWSLMVIPETWVPSTNVKLRTQELKELYDAGYAEWKPKHEEHARRQDWTSSGMPVPAKPRPKAVRRIRGE